MLDAHRVGTEDVALLALLEVAEQGVGAIRQAHFTDASQPLIRGQLEEGQVAPGAAHDQDGHVRDFHEIISLGR